MVLPRHGNHTLCSWLYRWFLLSFAHLLCCHSCQLFMGVHCFPLGLSAVYRTCIGAWYFRFLCLALFVTGNCVCQLVSLVSFSDLPPSLSDNDRDFCRFVGDVLPCFVTTCGGQFYSYFLELPDYYRLIYLSVFWPTNSNALVSTAFSLVHLRLPEMN